MEFAEFVRRQNCEHPLGAGSLGGVRLEVDLTVADDGVRDRLFGSWGREWYFADVDGDDRDDDQVILAQGQRRDRSAVTQTAFPPTIRSCPIFPELLAHYPAKDVCSWLGNSPDVANKHYAMTMQASFDRAAREGARIEGVTGGVLSKVPQKVPQTLQDKGGHPKPTKKAMVENPESNWVCLAMASGDSPVSYPART